MSTETRVPHAANQGVTAPPITSETLESTVRQICIFASRSEMKIASTIILEMQNQREQIKTKQDELSEVRKKLEDQKENQTIAMDQWSIGIQTQKSKIKAAEAQIQSLRESIAKKDNNLAESAQKIKNFAEETKKVQLEHLSEKTKVNQLSEEIISLRKKLIERNGIIDNLQTAELGMTKSLSSERKKNGELEKELISMKSVAQERDIRLQKLEGYGLRGHQMDEDSMIDGFSRLWNYATDQLYHIMMQNIDNAVLSNRTSLGCLGKGDISIRDVPMPLSNSPAAKGMRLAVILAILSKEIDQHIFQPNYLVPEHAQLRNIMSHLAETDGDKEYFCRSMLLSIDEQSQQETLQHRIRTVVHKVSSCVHGLLSDAQYNEFRQSVANTVQKAIKIWLPIQRAQQKYESDFDPVDWNDNEWAIFNLPGEKTEKNTTAHGMASDTLLTIFPRISQVKDNRRHPLTFVTQLTKCHPLCIQAEQEINKKPNSPTIGRTSLNGTRRKSIVANAHPNGNGFLEKKANGV
ncbi:hypothetical protein N7517_004458 [Penicillium concentricum]|uniref:MEI5 protein n=1 Tax=Penicillium concentricum TaxID=293559 RepID=A0A9W9S6B1_9EURO|nr:uncharacterized protein N7517_004458 [Penicillium concentricum]KAJ5372452.1 hypothetical protein N7517_004458 [Penicillium concentricum]